MSRVFRQKSIDRIASPDRLDEYIRVSNPSAWMILGVIILLIVGAAIWACFATLTDVKPGVVTVQNGQAICYLNQADAADFDAGDAVTITGSDAQGSIANVFPNVTPLEALPTAVQEATPTEQNETGWFCSAAVNITLPDGTYEAHITTQSYSPLALLFGQER